MTRREKKPIRNISFKPRPYPYKIPPVKFPEKMPNLWHVLEFLRGEALLRSPIVHKLYRKAKGPPDGLGLSERFGSGGHIFTGGHHLWLEPNGYDSPGNPPGWADKGLRDMGAISNLLPDQAEHWKHAMIANTSDYMYVEIAPAFPPKAILDALRPILVERHKATQGDRGEARLMRHPDLPGRTAWLIPFHTRKRPPIRDLKTWLNYLHCYDLRRCEGLSFGQIAKQVYGSQTKRDLAEKAFDRVTHLIQAAEQNDWPPSRL